METEKRLIYMEDTMEKLRAYAERKHEAGHIELANGILKAVNYIRNNIVRVDAVEVVHSEWERFRHPSGTHGIRCKNCKEQNGGRKPYCPNCGAKMDGERREGE